MFALVCFQDPTTTTQEPTTTTTQEELTTSGDEVTTTLGAESTTDADGTGGDGTGGTAGDQTTNVGGLSTTDGLGIAQTQGNDDTTKSCLDDDSCNTRVNPPWTSNKWLVLGLILGASLLALALLGVSIHVCKMAGKDKPKPGTCIYRSM